MTTILKLDGSSESFGYRLKSAMPHPRTNHIPDFATG